LHLFWKWGLEFRKYFKGGLVSVIAFEGIVPKKTVVVPALKDVVHS
jgi:hypothetical protein